MSLSVKQVNFLRDMLIKYKDYPTLKRLRKKKINKQEYQYLMGYFEGLGKSKEIVQIMR